MEQQTLTQEQVDERIAILTRFRQLLKQQRQKFKDYLFVLEKQEQEIEADNIDAMVQHTEIEQSIISEIHNIQKVVDPMEAMYKAFHTIMPDTEIPKLKTDLEKLQTEVLDQNAKNRELLKSHMQILRQKINASRTPYTKRSSIYASDAQTATLIDIQQ